MKKEEKEFKDFQAQLDLMKSRGLVVDNEDAAKNALSLISYYRLNSYRFPFYNKETKEYTDNKAFNDLLTLYNIDIKYKAILTEVLQMIEIAFKTLVIYHFSKIDKCFYIKEEFYNNDIMYDKNNNPIYKREVHIKNIKRTLLNDSNIHTKYFNENNTNCNPDAWIALEAFDFGMLNTTFI